MLLVSHHLTLGIQMTFYLVVQAASSKGSDQADVILNLLEYYDIVDQILLCAATLQVLTLVYSLESPQS